MQYLHDGISRNLELAEIIFSVSQRMKGTNKFQTDQSNLNYFLWIVVSFKMNASKLIFMIVAIIIVGGEHNKGNEDIRGVSIKKIIVFMKKKKERITK